ncbi:MAG: DHH family phosphoesterase [Puniceicoccales bacterium]|jgi:phosphoesterase RecJ-like protein|nr:DHH family phosphoesterase [Puniceicoccales bacterium]
MSEMKECDHFEGADRFFAVCRQLKGKKVGVIGHTQIDGDAVGAQVALFEILKNEGCEAFLMETEPGIPDHLRPLYGKYKTYQPHQVSVDEWCVVDCSQPSRVGDFFEAIRPFLLIDHHISGSPFAVHNFIHPQAAAACEILADYLYQAKYPISVVMANALYAGLIMDTGNYCYSSTRAATLHLGAYLVDRGIQPHVIASLVYNNEPRKKFLLLEHFFHSWKFYADGKICFGFLHDEDYEATGTDMVDVEGFVNYPRSIHGVRIAGLVQKLAGLIKVSLRSNEPALRLDQVAQRFQGGGHICAVAFKTTGTIESFWDDLINALQERLKVVEEGVLPYES